MRYNLESTLPINAFSPRGGRGPFSRGMTLEGGGGGGIVGAITNPISKALGTSGGGGGLMGALAGLDKTVGNTIPGGWGTLGTVAASMIPGGQFAAMGLSKAAAMGGLGALTGSGVLRPGRGFNVQGALMGGAAAYGMANLASGLEAAGGGAGPTASDVAAQLGVEGASTGAGSQAAMLAEQAAGMGSYGLENIASSAAPAVNDALAQGVSSAFTYAPSGEMIPTQIPVVPQPSALSNFGTGVANQASSMGRGISNLAGMGPEGTSAAAQAAFKGAGSTLTNTAMPILAGGTGLAAIDEQENFLRQQQASGAINNEEYNAQMAQIAAAREKAMEAMRANPYQFGSSTATTAEDAIRQNPYQFARGGEVPGYFGGGFTRQITENPKFIEAIQADLAPKNREILMNSGINQNIIDAANNSKLSQYAALIGKGDNEKSAGTALLNNPYQFAVGGSIDDEMGFDDSPRGLGLGNLSNGFMNMGSTPGYAMGGQPRFLSGGGDGLSDDIPAIIGDKQPARLADGEFVVSSDVVSNLGNGSSKAGAKKLYAMMDRVRQQAHGTKKQIRKVNATKALPA